MAQSLRLPAALLVGAAILAGIVAQLPFLDVEVGTRGSATNHEQVWGGSLTDRPAPNAALPPNGTAPATSYGWFDGDLDGARGINLVRFGGPVVCFGLLVLLGATVVVLGRRTLEGGLMALLGTFLLAAGILVLVMGLRDMNRLSLDGARFPLAFGPAFWVLVGSGTLALAGSLAAIADRSSRDSPVAGPDGPRPVLSTDNPAAFNPLASKDPKPFRPDPPRDFKSFRVKGGAPGGDPGFEEVGGEDEPPADPSPAPAPGRKPERR